MIRITILNNYGKLNISDKKIKEVIKWVLRDRNKDNVELSIVLCNDEYIRNYNRDFRGKDYPTDVLSFVDGDKVGKNVYLGDIIISIDRVKDQSYEYDVSFEEEFVRLLVHGTLHLLGYDHETGEDDEKLMMDLQYRLVDEIVNDVIHI